MLAGRPFMLFVRCLYLAMGFNWQHFKVQIQVLVSFVGLPSAIMYHVHTVIVLVLI